MVNSPLLEMINSPSLQWKIEIANRQRLSIHYLNHMRYYTSLKGSLSGKKTNNRIPQFDFYKAIKEHNEKETLEKQEQPKRPIGFRPPRKKRL